MTLFNFGQPHGSIVQVAYVVPDIRAAIDEYVETLGIGPWFMLEDFTGIDAKYRGQPTDASVTLASAFAGHMQVELITMNDEKPSVFKEVVDRRGYGFHHYGVAVPDVPARASKMAKDGWEPAFSTSLPTRDQIIYVDRKPEAGIEWPGMIELVPASDSREKLMTGFYAASLGWNGADRIRSFFS